MLHFTFILILLQSHLVFILIATMIISLFTDNKKRHFMKIVSSLVQGMESEENIKRLISFTDMTSELMMRALIVHYVGGAPIKNVCGGLGIDRGNFARDSKRINAIASEIDAYNETAHPHLSKQIKTMKEEIAAISSDHKSVKWNTPKTKTKGITCKN